MSTVPRPQYPPNLHPLLAQYLVQLATHPLRTKAITSGHTRLSTAPLGICAYILSSFVLFPSGGHRLKRSWFTSRTDLQRCLPFNESTC